MSCNCSAAPNLRPIMPFSIRMYRSLTSFAYLLNGIINHISGTSEQLHSVVIVNFGQGISLNSYNDFAKIANNPNKGKKTPQTTTYEY